MEAPKALPPLKLEPAPSTSLTVSPAKSHESILRTEPSPRTEKRHVSISVTDAHTVASFATAGAALSKEASSASRPGVSLSPVPFAPEQQAPSPAKADPRFKVPSAGRRVESRSSSTVNEGAEETSRFGRVFVLCTLNAAGGAAYHARTRRSSTQRRAARHRSQTNRRRSEQPTSWRCNADSWSSRRESCVHVPTVTPSQDEALRLLRQQNEDLRAALGQATSYQQQQEARAQEVRHPHARDAGSPWRRQAARVLELQLAEMRTQLARQSSEAVERHAAEAAEMRAQLQRQQELWQQTQGLMAAMTTVARRTSLAGARRCA